MKALFLVDNIPAMEMFVPIINKLPHDWEAIFVNYNGRTKQSRIRIDDYSQKLSVRCVNLGKQNRQSVEGILRDECPSIIILAREETTPVEPLFAKLGKAKSIPTLLVPHGMISTKEAQLWKASGRYSRLQHSVYLIKQGYRKLMKGNISIIPLVQVGLFRIRNDFRSKGILSRYDNYSMIASYGEAMNEILVRYKVKPENIVITGNPKFDVYYKDRACSEKGSILLFTEYLVEFGLWTPTQRENFVLDVYFVAKSLGQKLKVKIHPVGEDMGDYKRIVAKHHLPISIHQRESIVELIDDCGIAITTMSTTGLETMVAGKPLVIYNPYADVTPYNGESGAYFACNRKELLTVVKEILRDGTSQHRSKLAEKFIYRQAYVQDGKASERIVDLIAKMVKGGIKWGN